MLPGENLNNNLGVKECNELLLAFWKSISDNNPIAPYNSLVVSSLYKSIFFAS